MQLNLSILLSLYLLGNDSGIPETLNPDLDELENTGQGQILKGWGTVSICKWHSNIYSCNECMCSSMFNSGNKKY